MKHHKVIIDHNTCIGCGLCAKTCAASNIEIQNKKASIRLEQCIMCGQCSAICPKGAISLTGFEEKPMAQEKAVSLNPDDVLNVIRFRRSMRKFKDQEVNAAVIHQILEAGRLTHTAENKQDVSFIVLDQQKAAVEALAVRMFRRLKPLADLLQPLAKNKTIDDHFFFFQAPLVIVIVAADSTNGLLAAQNMEFVAEANGLGVLYSGFFTTAVRYSRKLKKALHIPKGKRAAMTLVMGYPNLRYRRSTPHESLNVTYL